MAVDTSRLRRWVDDNSCGVVEISDDEIRKIADEIDSLRMQLAAAKAVAVPWRKGPAQGGEMPGCSDGGRMTKPSIADDWIAVTDRLPNIGITVEAMAFSGEIFEMASRGDHWVQRLVYMGKIEWTEFNGAVTHWRPQR
jgi:hypothetical protein